MPMSVLAHLVAVYRGVSEGSAKLSGDWLSPVRIAVGAFVGTVFGVIVAAQAAWIGVSFWPAYGAACVGFLWYTILSSVRFDDSVALRVFFEAVAAVSFVSLALLAMVSHTADMGGWQTLGFAAIGLIWSLSVGHFVRPVLKGDAHV